MRNSDYLLGVNKQELERLKFQHTVWGPITRQMLTRLNIQAGWKCLDVGAGPGFVSMDLRELVGENGEISALEPSELYLTWFKKYAAQAGWTNIRFLNTRLEEADLPPRYFDLIFVRWVLSFVPDLEQFLARLMPSLKPGGIIAVQDYYYEGLSLFPRGGPWDRMADIVRTYYRSGNGDMYVIGVLPALFRKFDLTLIDFKPTCLAGGPSSDIFEWGHQFFSVHTQLMADKGIITQQEANALQADWNAHRNNPDALYFSPIVVDVAGVLSK